MWLQGSTALAGIAVVLGGGWIGWRMGDTPRAWRPVALIAAGFCVLWAVAHRLTDWWVAFEPWPEYFLYDYATLFFAAIIILSIAIRRSERRQFRLFIGTLAVVVGVYAVLEIGSPFFFRSALAGLSDDRALDPVSQSTGWSCSAAAAATLLRLNGISASEREVAELAATSPLSGTDDRGARRAIRILASPDGFSARLRSRVPAGELDALSVPCQVSYRLYTTVLHAAVLVSVVGDELELEDPLLGRQEWTREEFLSKWTGDAIELVKQPGL